MRILRRNRNPILTIVTRWKYYRRILEAYILGGTSHLTFWHDIPTINPLAQFDGEIDQYYMTFDTKADYSGPFDPEGIPLLDYRGKIGKQYNPIAIAQYGLGNYNRYCQTGSNNIRNNFLVAADWLVNNLQANKHGFLVWNHYFDFEYRDHLRAPWYSGLAQGQGISLLLRAYKATNQANYLDSAHRAFESFLADPSQGGITWNWPNGDIWFEEYIVDPPTHILNGFIWALWGVYDYYQSTGSKVARSLFENGIKSLEHRLPDYDWSNWSLYELSGTKMKMIASPFYHRLHVVQLRATARLSGNSKLVEYADRWERFTNSYWSRTRALVYKILFKIFYY